MLGVEATSIITDAQTRRLLGEMQTDLSVTGLGVLLDVGEPFLSYAVECQQCQVGKSFLVSAHFEVNCQRVLAQLFYQKRNPVDASKWFLFGPQRTDRAAHILQGLFHHPLRITDSLESFLRLFVIIYQRLLQL